MGIEATARDDLIVRVIVAELTIVHLETQRDRDYFSVIFDGDLAFRKTIDQRI